MGAVEIGDRVLVDGKLGIVRYVGLTDFCEGIWYGVELDECQGMNNGSVRGRKYFDLHQKQGNYGIFAGLENITQVDDHGRLRNENIRLSKIVEVLEHKVRQLHNKWVESNQESNPLEDQNNLIEELQETIEKLILQQEDYEQRCSSLKQELVVLQTKNKSLNLEIESFKEQMLPYASSAVVGGTVESENIDIVSLRQRNTSIEEVVTKLEHSLSSLTTQYELLLEENTLLVEINSSLEEKMATSEKPLPRLKEHQPEVQDTSNDVVDYLKKQTNEMSKALESLTVEADRLKDENRQHLFMQSVRIETEKALRDKLEKYQSTCDENMLSGDSDSPRHSKSAKIQVTNNIWKGADELCIEAQLPREEPIKSFTAELYNVVFNGEQEMEDLRIQFEILLKIVTSDSISISRPLKMKFQCCFALLCEVTKELLQKSSCDCYEQFKEEFGEHTSIITSLLDGTIPQSSVEISDILNFIRNNNFLNTSFRLLVTSLYVIFVRIMTPLFRYLQKQASSEDQLRRINEIYSTSTCIEKQAKYLSEQRNLCEEFVLPNNMLTSDILDKIFSVINTQALNKSIKNDLDDSINAINEISDFLNTQVLALPEMKPNGQDEQREYEGLEDILTSDEKNDLPEMQNVGNMKSSLKEKDEQIEELLGKIQLLENKINAKADNHINSETLKRKVRQTELESKEKLSAANSEILKLQEQLKINYKNQSDDSSSGLEIASKSDIYSEVKDLRRFVARLLERKPSQLEFNWLNDKDFAQEGDTLSTVRLLRSKTNSLAKGISDFSRYSVMVSYRDKDSPHCTGNEYISNAKFKQKVFNLKIREICT